MTTMPLSSSSPTACSPAACFTPATNDANSSRPVPLQIVQSTTCLVLQTTHGCWAENSSFRLPRFSVQTMRPMPPPTPASATRTPATTLMSTIRGSAAGGAADDEDRIGSDEDRIGSDGERAPRARRRWHQEEAASGVGAGRERERERKPHLRFRNPSVCSWLVLNSSTQKSLCLIS